MALEIFAHRGFPLKAPENTLPAFQAALDAGARAIECDILLSRDGIPFIFHDRTLDRTTNAQGMAQRRSWAELCELDAGAWFGESFKGTRIPSLEETLLCFGDRVFWNLEIKKEAVGQGRSGGVEEKLVNLVRAMKLDERVLISSFSGLAVKRVASLAPHIQTAFLRSLPVRGSAKKLVTRFGATGLHVPARGLRQDFVLRAQNEGVPLRVYTVNKLDEAKRFQAWGVQGLFTDNVAEMVVSLS